MGLSLRSLPSITAYTSKALATAFSQPFIHFYLSVGIPEFVANSRQICCPAKGQTFAAEFPPFLPRFIWTRGRGEKGKNLLPSPQSGQGRPDDDRLMMKGRKATKTPFQEAVDNHVKVQKPHKMYAYSAGLH